MGSWEEDVRQFMLDEKELDDELFFVIVPAVMSCLYDEKINPFSQIEGLEVQSAPSYLNIEEQESASGKKRKQNQMAAKLDEFIDLRKIQMEKNQEKLDEKKKKEDDYYVEKCIAIVDSIEDLTIEQKADANELFQSEMNRQIFMMTKNPAVRLVWLKKKIHSVHLLNDLLNLYECLSECDLL
ncbi:uncharacterized protein [Miscanthus floridulus]|uniref:uncharacterized protein n=1 Tax=Miscanthus floridulus TaxID=154761 RepID=UPI00345A7658